MSQGKAFRKAIKDNKPLQIVGTINAYSSLLAKKSGHKAIYLSGGGVAASSLGVPDLGITTLNDVLVDVDRITRVCDLPLLVDVDTGWGEAFNISRPIIGARGVGLSQGAIDHALAFVKNKQAFGEEVVNFQGVRWMLADMHIQTEAARGLVYKAAAAADAGVTGKALAKQAAVAKCHASDTAMKVATDAVQLFGAAGISGDYPINRYFRDAKVLQIVEGTQQVQRNIISRYLVDGY